MVPAGQSDCIDEALEHIDETMKNRSIARRMVNDAASAGHPLAGAVEALENLAASYYLGLDADENDEDLDVYP